VRFFAKSMVLALVISFPTSAISHAELDCQSFTFEYNQTLNNYLQNTSINEQDLKKLEKLKKRTERQLKQCIKAINRDFKNTIRELKITYPRVPDSRELNLSNKSKKDEGIATATLERDRRIQSLPRVQPLPFQK
jgi:response regulator RpfG family c-di-GMP phosphodiesterase